MRFKELKLNESELIGTLMRNIVGGAGAGGLPGAGSAGSADSDKPLDFKSAPGQVDPNQVKSYLKSKGLDNNQVAGMLANIKHESNFVPGAVGDNGTSGGLFQHHANRFRNMVAAVGKDWQSNWKGQVDFALSEGPGQQYASLRFNSPEQATKWWTINFEIPANKHAQANIRSQSASQFA